MQNPKNFFLHFLQLTHILQPSHKIYAIFMLLASVMIAIVFCRIDCLQSDIYALIDFDSTQKNALQKVQQNVAQNFAKDISFLSDDEGLLSEILGEFLGDFLTSTPNNLFENVKLSIENPTSNDSTMLEDLYSLRLALLEYKTFLAIINNPNDFFANNANEFLHSFALRPLSPSKDFFNLLGHSSLLANENGLKLDIASGRLYALDTNTQKKYYFASAHLAENFDTQALLDFIAKSRAKAQKAGAHLLIQGGAIFGAIGKREGIKESVFMGGLSFILVSVLLFLAFGSVRIFCVVLVVLFSFLCGLSASLLVFSDLHILTVVISTSLVGLIVDFAMHYLAKEQGKNLQASSVKSMKNIFLLGLFITASGYGLFLFSPMPFLHQIAVMSIFTLIGAFFASYFLLPHLLQGGIFAPKMAFKKPFLITLKILKPFFRTYIYIFAPFIVLFSVLLLFRIDMQENIATYSTIPKEALDELQDFARLTNSNTQKFILLNDIEKERKLMQELMTKNIIDRYDGLSSFVLSQDEQTQIINAFKKHSNNNEILGIYEKLGFAKNEVKEAFLQIASLSPYSLEQILAINADFEKFVIKQNQMQNHAQNPYALISFPHFVDLGNGDDDKAQQILATYQAEIIDVPQRINSSLNAIKHNAIWLKILGYMLAFVALFVAFGGKKSALKKSTIMISVVLLSTLASLAIMLAFGNGFDIFVVFGLVISSAVGIDYVILATNPHLSPQKRVFGITLASLTSIISFCLLSFSGTQAVVSFGLSATLGMAFCALGAIALALKIDKTT
ncbi:hypothetical protein [Helicobacter sp. T3_23-1056]